MLKSFFLFFTKILFTQNVHSFWFVKKKKNWHKKILKTADIKYIISTHISPFLPRFAHEEHYVKYKEYGFSLSVFFVCSEIIKATFAHALKLNTTSTSFHFDGEFYSIITRKLVIKKKLKFSMKIQNSKICIPNLNVLNLNLKVVALSKPTMMKTVGDSFYLNNKFKCSPLELRWCNHNMILPSYIWSAYLLPHINVIITIKPSELTTQKPIGRKPIASTLRFFTII